VPVEFHRAAMNLHTALVELLVNTVLVQVSKHQSEVLVWVIMLMHMALAAVAATNHIHLNKHLLNKQIFSRFFFLLLFM